CRIWAGSRQRLPDAPPVFDRLFMAGHDLDGELAVARGFKRLDAPLDLGLAGGERRLDDHLGGDELLFLGLQEYQMPAMVLEIARILRLEAAGKLDVTLNLRRALRQHGDAGLEPGQRLVGRAMQHHSGTRSGLGHGTLRIGPLAVLQDATECEGGRVEVRRGVTGLLPLLLHRRQFLDAVLDLADEIDPACLHLGSERARTWTKSREMQLDRVLGVEQRQLGIEEADLPFLALHLELDGLAAQVPIDLVDVSLHVFDLDRAKAHGAPGGEAGADAEIDSA